MNESFAIPAPPSTISAPVVELLLAVVDAISTAPPMKTAPAIPVPPATVSAPVVVLVDAVVADTATVDALASVPVAPVSPFGPRGPGVPVSPRRTSTCQPAPPSGDC
jgi:hypothetical protein